MPLSGKSQVAGRMNSLFTVCFQHDEFVVIDKPAGVSVHKDQQAVGFLEKITMQLGVPKLWLVHRLDKVTSGLLILAKSQASAAYFGELFAQHQIRKTYWAMATEKPKKKQGKIVGDMVKARNGAWKLCQSKENPAITHFSSYSVVPHLRHFILQPQTGKTHQLRVALKSLGSPILGDRLYGGVEADRVYLHAYQLQFRYHGQAISLICPPTSGQFWQQIPAVLPFESSEKKA